MLQIISTTPPSLSSTHVLCTKVVLDKYEDPMVCFGAALGQDFICVGGQNIMISLQTAEAHAEPSLFAYPSPTKSPKNVTVTKVAMAVLLTTVKINGRAQKAAVKGDFMAAVVVDLI
jgi:26S proteasome regulatory subunit N2